MKTIKQLFKSVIKSCLALFITSNSFAQCSVSYSVGLPSCNNAYFHISSIGSTYYKWDFGDGTILSTSSDTTTHIYSFSNNTYTASLSAYSNSLSATPCSVFTNTIFVNCIPSTTCSASFSANQYTCNVYNFTNTSSGANNIYNWSFGDSTYSNSASNINHIYSSIGIYTITLDVYNISNTTTPCSSSSETVNVNCITSTTCQSSFLANQDSASCNTFNFTDNSISLGSLRQWIFGDGSSYYTYNNYPVNHTYSSTGNYNVTLNIFDIANTNSTTPCSSSTQSVTVNCNVVPCQASFISTQSNCNTVQFANNSTGTINQYLWDFGDGIMNYVNDTSSVIHTYYNNGNYVVTLTAFSNISNIPCSSITQTIAVNCNTNSVCQSIYSILTPDSINCNKKYFSSQSTGSISVYVWDFGDGTTTSTYYNNNSTQHIYNIGTYTTTLFIYSATNSITPCSSSTQIINVTCNGGGTLTPTNCSASFSSYTDSLCNTYFTNTSSGSNLNSYWTINGNYYSGYDQMLQLPNGSYNVSLFNYSGGTFCDSTTQMITVACNGGTVNPAGCQANSSFLIFADSINSGNYFAYNMSSGTGTTSYLWSFGDGSTSTQQYPFHQYAAPGHYIVCLTVTATNGTTTCTDSYCDSSSVQRVAAGFLMHQINVIPQGTAGVKENTLINRLKTYPNPLTDVLTVEVELTNNTTDLEYSIIDALGKVILKNNLEDSKTTINTSGLDKGFYFLSISTQDGKVIKTSKLVK